ncbi:MAG: spore maturation protein [Clostridia bacterium]|nr:spore maturation protein [Clostridia bacterium]
MLEYISSLAIPAVICIAGAFMLFGKKPYFESFIEGARDGLKTAVGILPTLIALMIAINMLNASGITDFLSSAISPAAAKLGVPSELIPLLITRPVSGSASTAAYSSLIERYGTDSFVGLCASVIMGSSDTMLYVIGVYFSSVGIKKSRYAIPCAAAVMLFCIFFSCLLCRIWFKGVL